MAQSIDMDLLRKVTVDSIRVYDAVSRAHAFTAESQRVVTMAEDLLRRAGLAYLLESPGNKAAQASGPIASPREMVSASILIQQFYSDLKDALYQLAKAHTEAKAWEDARTVMEARLKIDPQYRDVAAELQEILSTRAKDLFGQGKWEEGRTILKQRPTDKEIRLAYLYSFLDEDASMNGVRALQKEEPRVSKLPSFQRILSNAEKLADVEAEYVHFPYMPSSPYTHSYTSSPELQQKWDEEDRIAKAKYDAEMRKYNIQMKEYEKYEDKRSNAQYKFDDSLQGLRAELSSIIAESK